MRVSFDDFELDSERRELRRHGDRVRADPLVVDLLACLVAHAGELVTYEQLIAEVWQGRAVADNVISVSMAKLRRALGQTEHGEPFILNVYGRGYRFVPKVVEHAAPASGGTGSIPPPSEAPFVGRQSVLTGLRAALREAAAGRGGICALIGEPGIGKTRTVEALERESLAYGAPFAWARMRALDGAPPLWPLVQALRAVLAKIGGKVAEQRLGAGFADLARVLPELSRSPRKSDAPARYLTYDAIGRLLALAGESGPCVLVLDDLHGSDEGSLELLAYLTPELDHLPVLLLATLRSGERPLTEAGRARLDYVLGHRSCRRFELGRLSPQEVADYTAQQLGRSEPALAQAVFDKSEGNPFLMTELVGRAREAGRAAAQALTLPGPALELMRQRVRKLDAQARGLLSCAALIGRSFELGLLSAITEQPVPALLEQLEDALATDVIVAAQADPNRFAFGHDLIREVLREGLPPTEERKLHLRIGQALERRRAHGIEVTATELSHYFVAALPEGEPARAVRYAAQAADEASAAIAYADAVAGLRRALAALDLVPDAPPRLRCELLCQLSIHQRPLDVPAARQALERAANVAREHGLGDVLAFVGLVMSPSPGVVASPGASQVLEDALKALPEARVYERARVLAHLAWIGPYCFDRVQSAELAARARQHAEASGSPLAAIDALWAELYLGAGPERVEAETERLATEVARLGRTEPHHARARTEYELAMLRVVRATQHGDRAGVDRAVDALGRCADEFRFTELDWHHRRVLMIERMNRGELLQAEPELRALGEQGARLHLFAHEIVWGHDFLVWTLQVTGLPTARNDRVGVPLFDPGDPPNVLALRLRTQLALGRRAEAEAIYELFLSRDLRRLPCDRDYLGTLSHLAEAAVTLQRRDAAEIVAELIAPHRDLFGAEISLHSRGSMEHWLGLVERALGRAPEAALSFERAIARNDAFGLAPRAAESRYELAATLAQHDASSLSRARELCERARNSASAMGMGPLLARCDSLLAELAR